MAPSPRAALAAVLGAALVVGALAPATAAQATPPRLAPASASAATVEVAGVITPLSEGGIDPARVLFHVDGHGYLTLDASGVGLDALPRASVTLQLVRPADAPATLESESDFDAWARSSIRAPLVAVGARATAPRATDAFINRTPVTSADHKVYAVLVTPSNVPGNTAAANQTAPKVQAAIDYVDQYWSDQSGGKVGFELMGTTSWHKSTQSCGVFSDGLWNQAAGWAKSELGYRDGPNTHLVVLLPSGSSAYCGPAGLGTIGLDVNTGGVLWADGTSDDPYELQTIAHELGHNLSFGHANWLHCSGADEPAFALSSLPGSCTPWEYGDVVDPMGGGVGGRTNGAFSSPNAIRAGLWSSDAYAVAPVGTTSYTLSTVSGGTGLRSVVVEDTNGVAYFAEFRDYTGEDAQWVDAGCSGGSCVPGVDGVRVLRLAPGSPFKGDSGDGTYAIGRTVAGSPRSNYVAAESFDQGSGLRIQVTSIDGPTATISVTRPQPSLRSDGIQIYQTSGSNPFDSTWVAGDRLVAFLGAAWRAETVTFQWYRNGTAISGATGQAYTLSGSDVGRYLKVKVTGRTGSSSKAITDPPSPYIGYGPVRGGALTAGTVVIDNSATPLRAVASGWTSGTKFSYQWYRGSAAISKATKSSYTPTSADRGKLLKVRVRGSKTGYTAASVTSAAKDYTVTASGVPVLSGTARVGEVLSVSQVSYSTVDGPIATPTRRYQWFRSGAAIRGATAASYTQTASDYGKKLTVRVTGGAPGWIAVAQTTAASSTVARGIIQRNDTTFDVVKSPASLVLKAVPSATITEPGVAYAYQWYRGTAKIAKATKSSYTLVSADYGKEVRVRVSVKKKNYTSIALESPPHAYSILPSAPAPVITGELALGAGANVLELAPRDYTGGGVLEYRYQWYRDASAIPAAQGGTSAQHTIVAKDVGHALKVKVTVRSPGWLSSVSTSAATAKIGRFALAGWNEQQLVTLGEVLLPTSRTLTAAGTGITEPGATVAYQWYRGSAKIAKATRQSYTLTASDYGKAVKVVVTTSKKNFTTIVKSSAPVSYSVLATGKPVIAGTAKVGLQLTVTLPAYTPAGFELSYQWYRDGKAISGANLPTLTPDLLEQGRALTVKVTATKEGYLPSILTSAKTAKVAAG